MKQLLLIACLIGTPALADEWRCDAQHGVMYQSSRVVALPAEQNKPYCTVIGNPADPQYRQLCAWFDQNPSLADLKAKSHFHTLDSTSMMFRTRYAASVDQLPCVRIQKSDGTVLAQISGSNIPLTSDAMVNCLNATLRRGVQPSPYNIHLHYAVAPDKPDQPTPQPDKYVQPDVFDDSWPASRIWTLVIAGVVSVLAGVGWQWNREE